MKNLEIMIFKFIIKSYKLIKHILYKIFIFPFQLIAWLTLRFWHKNLHGWRRYYKVIYYDKILVYFGMIFVLLCMLKHTHFLLYEPLAYDTSMHWPKRIGSLRLLALVHWISCMFVYTALYLLSWIFWQVHYYFKEYGQTLYFDWWFWYHMWFHGIFWDAFLKYLDHGYGITGTLYFIIMNFYFWLSFQGCEFLEDMEYDWDDYFDAYEGASVECDGVVVQVNDYFVETLGNKEQALLDEITWDIFGSTEKIGEDTDKISERWMIWELYMMPPVAYTDDDLFELEAINYVLNVPYNLLDYYTQLIADRPRVNDEEYWWYFWTTLEESTWDPIIMEAVGPLVNFFRMRLISFHTLPRKRIRAVGEYSRYNWRYKRWMTKFDDIPNYEGWGQVYGPEFIAIMKHIGYVIWAFFLWWWRLARYVWRDWKFLRFRNKYKKQIRKLRKWGSKNYSFFGKKNYRPKK